MLTLVMLNPFDIFCNDIGSIRQRDCKVEKIDRVILSQF